MNDSRLDVAATLTRMARHLTDAEQAPLEAREQKALKRLVADEQFRVQRKRCRLRELPLAAILPGVENAAISLAAVNVETGHPNHAEMLWVIAAAQHRRARRVFEFGTFMGRTTRHLAAAMPDAHIWTLDLPRDENPWSFADHVGAMFAGTSDAERITSVRTNSATFDTSPLRGSMDFVWVDADHSYDGVRNDTEKAFELLAPGGAIMWHDFSADSPGLVDFIAEFTARQPLFLIQRTSVLLHLDGVDPLTFTPHPIPYGKHVFKGTPGAV